MINFDATLQNRYEQWQETINVLMMALRDKPELTTSSYVGIAIILTCWISQVDKYRSNTIELLAFHLKAFVYLLVSAI